MTRERGRLRITGFDAERVVERDPISDWSASTEVAGLGDDGEAGGVLGTGVVDGGRSARAWARFRRNRSAMAGGAIVLALVLLAIFARPIEVVGVIVQPISLAPYDPAQVGLLHGVEAHRPPSRAHPFGTDHQGRDVFSRVVTGGRWSLSIGFLAVGLAVLVGVPIGAVAGYYGGRVDDVVMRVVDVLYAFPFLVLALAVVAIVGRGFWELVFALTVVGWIGYARLIRGEVLRVREREYVLAARAIGARDRTIVRRHVVPNAMAPVVVQATLGVGTTVLAVAALGFLGLGPSTEAAEWGTMLQATRETIVQGPGGSIPWWVTVFPGTAVFLFVLSINLVGDGVRDAFDPHRRPGDDARRGGL